MIGSLLSPCSSKDYLNVTPNETIDKPIHVCWIHRVKKDDVPISVTAVKIPQGLLFLLQPINMVSV